MSTFSLAGPVHFCVGNAEHDFPAGTVAAADWSEEMALDRLVAVGLAEVVERAAPPTPEPPPPTAPPGAAEAVVSTFAPPAATGDTAGIDPSGQEEGA